MQTDYQIGTQEYIVSEPKKLGDFIEKEIGVEYEITLSDFDNNHSVTVFELLESEHQKIKKFMKDEL
jgi:hypothetical protein